MFNYSVNKELLKSRFLYSTLTFHYVPTIPGLQKRAEIESSTPVANLVTSWGSATGEPVLLVHGRQDSMATFVPLLQLMPKQYYYVNVDMPGNGRSDAMPIGLKLSRFHFTAAVEVVVKTLGWERFIYMGHSMGCEHGLFYNTLHPGQIEKLILLDPIPSLQRLKFSDPEEYYQAFYDSYYSNYDKQNQGYKVYTREKAVETVMKARALTETQAELILSRNLIEIGDGLYRLSWDNRLKTLAPQNYMSDYYYELFSKNAPPTLVVAASDGSAGYVKGRESAKQLIEKMAKNLKNFHMVTVEGGHDVHFTHPDKCVGFVREFMDKDHGKSKL